MVSISDEDLRYKLQSWGFEPGPITPATRTVYERKLERLTKDAESNSRRLTRSNISTQAVNTRGTGSTSTKASVNSSSWTPLLGGAGAHSSISSPHAQPRYETADILLRKPLFFQTSSSLTQQNPGHTPYDGPRAPLRTVNTDFNYNSPNINNDDLQRETKYAQSNTTQDQLKYRGSRQSSSRLSFDREPSALRDANTSTPNSLLMASNDRLPQSFLSACNSGVSGIGSGLLSENSSTANVSRVSQDKQNNLHQSSCMEHNFSNFFGFSLGSHVPNLILICGIILFVIIASSYLLLQDKHGNVGKIADLQKLICYSNEINKHDTRIAVRQSECINSQDLSLVLKIVHQLFEILSRLAGEYRCGESIATSKMDVQTAKRLVKGYFSSNTDTHIFVHEVDTLWNNVLTIILEVGRRHFDIVAYGREGQNPAIWHDVTELESLRPYIPGSCRIRLLIFALLNFLYKLLWLLVILAVVGGVSYVIYRLKQSNHMKATIREKRVRDIVRQISIFLQQQLQRRQTRPTEPAYIPVSAIKETLSHTNTDLTDLWDDVVHYVHLVEGSILVQEWRGVGETWQWQGGSGWQGSALMDQSQHLPFTLPPTECLKVRNMFNGDARDFHSERRLKRELLKRIAECGTILHIGLDYQNNQGLVYIKCASPEVAGRVYEAIHANYFDSHLLTVKFLRLSKYHLRFPEAHNAVKPLSATEFE